jgi:hypothetical protein
VFPAELEISTIPRDVIGAPLVIVEELLSLTVAALMAPDPVSTVDAALEIVTSCAAVIVAEVLEKVFEAPVDKNEMDPFVELTFPLTVIEPPR